MRIAIPVAGGLLSSHFGRCEEFAILNVDEKGEILATATYAAPPHEPGLLPAWLAEKGADLVIASGMGPRAVSLFEAQGISVVLGAPVGDPETLAREYVAGRLRPGESTCDHPDGHHGCRH